MTTDLGADQEVLHLVKLAVGASDVAHLRQWQAEHARRLPPLRHRTRRFPRRASEIVSGGSIYWVIGGFILVRQRVVDIIATTHEDCRACTDLRLDPALILVEPRPLKAFQGWRYLEAAAAPRDLAASPASLGASDSLKLQLRTLCLL